MKKIIVLICFIALFIVSCDDQIVSECDTTKVQPAISATFTSIQNNVFSKSCAVSGCHVESLQDPVLTEGKAYNNIVNVMTISPPLFYVKPFSSDSSYIVRKLRGVGIQGERMPLNRQPLSDAVIDSIAAWIDRGALNN